jgi:hypothetical protein
MITWISSYPRSGNTMLRVMFKEVFGVGTFTKYPAGHARMVQAVGTLDLGSDWPTARERLRADPGMHFVKTHEGPESADEACIYVVRDPQAAIVSYRHFLRDINGIDLPLPLVAMGICPFGSWSDHVAAWAPAARPNTLLLRFEELVGDPGTTIERISAFTGLAPTGTWNGDIARLKPTDGSFFRSGSNQRNRDELLPLERRLIAAQHGPLAETLGYRLEEVSDEEASVWLQTVKHLAGQVDDLRRVAEERLQVIHDLDKACRERLELIERLHHHLNP